MKILVNDSQNKGVFNLHNEKGIVQICPFQRNIQIPKQIIPEINAFQQIPRISIEVQNLPCSTMCVHFDLLELDNNEFAVKLNCVNSESFRVKSNI